MCYLTESLLISLVFSPLGSITCGSSTMESAHALKTDHCTTVTQLTKELQDVKANLEARVVGVEQENKGLRCRVLSLQDDWDQSVKSLKSQDMQERQVKGEEKQNSVISRISCGKKFYFFVD